ncbi:thioredoxin-like protein [Hyaloraphidium curvatum]|nr:thioredoxin-like protein [Hyaloraphidium curvatum]
MAKFKDELEFKITWHPFLLDPTLPKQGVNKLERYKSKFGEARVKQMIPHMQQVFEKEGLTVRYDGVIAQTVESHRLVDFVQSKYGPEVTDKLMDKLFAAYFDECKNISDLDVLVGIATSVGVDKEEIETYLKSGKDYDRILGEAMSWSRRGVNGVPFFIFNKKYSVSGAQDSELFAELIEEVSEKL